MKKVLFTIFVLLFLVITGGYFYLNSTKPTYEGELILGGLANKVIVKFDPKGIPHIYAESKEDAYYSLGYLQSQDRLFQMEMIRRIATGTLSEVLGEEFADTDKLFRTLSIEQKSQEFYKAFQGRDGEYKTAAEAYFDGINEFVREGPTPIEFTVIGIPKREFTVKDAYNAAGYMAFGFADGFRVDPLTTKIAMTLGKEYLEDIGLHSHYDSSYIKSYINEESLNLAALAKNLDDMKIPLIHGSNSWVVGSEKSATGAPIFENDTHIGYSQPSVWFEAHLEYDDTSIYGHFLGGFPFAILGHNSYAAWGMTMFENDDVDLFQEKLNPDDENQILRNGSWKPLTQREEVILVKDNEPIKLTVKSSDHGPIVSNILVSDSIVADPVSVYWEFLHGENDLLEPTYNLGLTSNISEAREAVSLIEAPGLNVMYADKEGNIAWWAAARLPIRPAHSNSKLILDGTGKDDYLGYYPFNANPQAENPPWNYVYSANNQPDTVNGKFFPGYYRPLDRASRITKLLEAKDKWTVTDIKRMTADVTSGVAQVVSKEMALELAAIDGELYKDLILILSTWDGDHQVADNGPSVYYNFLSWTFYYAMADELGYDDYKALSNLEVMKRSYLMFLQNDSSIWWDDKATTKVETQMDILDAAARATLKTLENVYNSNDPATWAWGTIHTLNHGHALGQVDALKPYFDVGPYPITGGNEVINNMMFRLDTTGYFPVYAGPSMRTIIDLGNIEKAESINPTGQSGHFLSPFYANQAQEYVNVEFRPQLMNEAEIETTKSSTLILMPKN
jgi:penicillin amidase